MTTPTPNSGPVADALAAFVDRHPNPDTGLPMPSPSEPQLALVVELLTTAGTLVVDGELPVEALRDLLTEAVVRQHGRTTRTHLAELRDLGASFDRDAVALLGDAVTDGTVSLDRVRGAQQLATAAATLRTTMLRGHGA